MNKLNLMVMALLSFTSLQIFSGGNAQTGLDSRLYNPELWAQLKEAYEQWASGESRTPKQQQTKEQGDWLTQLQEYFGSSKQTGQETHTKGAADQTWLDKLYEYYKNSQQNQESQKRTQVEPKQQETGDFWGNLKKLYEAAKEEYSKAATKY